MYMCAFTKINDRFFDKFEIDFSVIKIPTILELEVLKNAGAF